MIEITSLTKVFGPVRAVDDLTFTVQPGRITGFLGPNGAGKTTTLRCLLGLVHPTAGTTAIEGQPYTSLTNPASVVGAALEAASFHPGRTGLDHLRMLAPSIPAPDSRCMEVLELVGLASAAKRRVGGYSLGMRGRLALAVTLLGNPRVLVLDEPSNGLDPEGIAWLRGLLRYQAGQGCTVLISSHLLSEVAQTVDDVVIISRGRLVHASTLAGLEALSQRRVRVKAPDAAAFAALATSQGWVTEPNGAPGAQVVLDTTAAQVGAAAYRAGVELHELSDATDSLETLFLRMVDGNGADTGADTGAGGSVAA